MYLASVIRNQYQRANFNKALVLSENHGMIDVTMETLYEFLLHYGLVVLSIGSFFEGEMVLIAAGILSHRGIFSPLDVWIVATLGSWFGHVFWFFLGRYFKQKQLFRLIPGWRKNLHRVNQLICKRPKTAIVFLQYAHGVRLLGAIAFGFTRISVLWFLGAQLLNCMVWAAVVSLFGYTVGEAITTQFANTGKIVWMTLTLILLVIFIKKYSKNGGTTPRFRAAISNPNS